ncbi:MAG: PqqD family protein [Actinomycetota bacterium]
MAWLARSPEVVSTELEDGAVLLNMETRLYYSLNQEGLEIWSLLESATGPDELARLLTHAFDVDEERARTSVSAFLRELEQERLVVASDQARTEARSGGEAPSGHSGATGRPFLEPELVKHDEPLHEVSASPFDPQLPLAE